MPPAPSIPGDEERLAALRSYKLLDTLPEQSLDDLTSIAAQICDAPVSLISLVDEHRQWFKSRIGFESTETPRDISFCGHAIAGSDVFIVPDAKKDARFADNPLVTDDPNIRFYAGAPLLTPGGHAIGTLCIMDRRPRRLTTAQIEALRALGRQVVAQFELKRQAAELNRRTGQLRVREEQLSLFVAHSPAAVAMFDREMRYLAVSRRWMEDFRLGEQSIEGRSHYELFPEIPERWRDVLRRCLDGAVETSDEDRFVRADGTLEWLRWEVRPWRQADGRIGGIMILSEVITARKVAEDALRENERQYRRLFAGNPHPMWVYDTETLRFLAVNDAAVGHYGYSHEEFSRMTIKDIRPQEELPRLLESLKSRSAQLQSSGVWKHRKSNGEVIDVEITSHLLEFDGRQAKLVHAHDVTARLRAERELVESREQFKALAEHSLQGIVLVQGERVIYVNPAVERITGYSFEECTHQSLAEQLERIHPEDRALLAARREEFETGEPVREGVEMRLLRKDGEWRWVHSTTKSFLLAGVPTRLSMMVDITERKNAIVALGRSEERLRMTARAANVGLWDWDIANNKLWYSPEWKAQIGYSDEEIGDGFEEWQNRVHPDDLEGALTSLRAYLETPRPGYEAEFRLRHKDGSYRWILSKGSIVSGPDGKKSRMLGSHLDITERKRIEAKLQASESRFHALFEYAPDGILIADKDAVYLDANASACRMFGYTRDEMIGTHATKLTVENEHAHIEPALGELNQGRDYRREWQFRRKNGSTFPADVIATTMPNGNIVAILRDITERRRAEEQRREAEQRLIKAFNGSPVAVAIGRVGDRKIVEVNEAFCALFDVDHGKAVGRTVADLNILDDSAALEIRQVLLAKGSVRNLELEVRASGGDPRHVIIGMEVIQMLDEPHVVATFADITKRKEAELRIQQLNRVYAVLSEINQTIVHEKNTSDMLAGACRIAVETGGLALAWIGLVDPDSGSLEVAAQSGASAETYAILQMLVGGDRPDCDFTHHALKTGEHGVCNSIATDARAASWRQVALERDYRSMASLPLKSAGRILGTFNLYSSKTGYFDEQELKLLDELAADIGFAIEIDRRETGRRRAEAELRWRTAFFEAQVDSSLDGILVVDDQGRKIVQNQRMIELWKLPPEIVAEEEDSKQIQFGASMVKDPEAFLGKVAHLNSHPDEVSRDQIELLNGTVLDRSSAPVRDKAGKHYGRIWTFRDISEQRRLEAQFRQSQKMEAIGQLAGGVAHDFNNILAAIMMQADLASSAGDIPDITREMLDDIRSASERAANLTRQLLAFSRRQVMQPRVLDLNEIVTNLAKMLQRILGEDIRLHFNLHPRSLFTRADAGMLDQVLLNLVVNARDAMPRGGDLSVSTRAVTLTPDQAADIPDALPGTYTCVAVKDTGVGIKPEHLSRIFEPFFTTKEPGKGTGLGLATVFGIVKQHGGALRVESEVGNGTLFEFMLPAASISEEPGGKVASVAPRGGTETILLVEDDAAVRMLTRIVLENKDYTVLEAENGVAALGVWEKHEGAIDLLFTDLVMPEGLSGSELAARLQSLKPDLKVIFTSGYSADIAGRELELKTGQNFIQKPSAPTTLLEIVRRSLDS